MLSYTDLLRVSHADAVDDDADNVESIVFNMFTVRQDGKRNSSHFADKHQGRQPQFYQNEFHACQYAKVNFGRIVTTTDVIKYGLNKIHAS
jgi:hypothetical protein